MRCTSPLQAFYYVRKDGKKDLKFRSGKRIECNSKSYADAPLIDVPCGQCIACRLRRSADWATRIVKELTQYEHSCFVTLTYDNDHLPSDKSLHHEHLKKFFDTIRSRNRYGIKFNGVKYFFDDVRYFCCGEYGKCDERPHYHAIIFGFDCYDRQYYKKNSNGDTLFQSPFLESIWNKGFVVIGDVTFESAAYVARYCLKKVTGKEAVDHYKGRKPEYSTSSKGIGRRFYEKYSKKVYRQDGVRVRGHWRTPPRYFDKLLELEDVEVYNRVKDARVESMLERVEDCMSSRLRASEIVQKAKCNLYERKV